MGNCFGKPHRSKKKDKRRAKAGDGEDRNVQINLGVTSDSSKPILEDGASNTVGVASDSRSVCEGESSNSLLPSNGKTDDGGALAIDDFVLGLRIGEGTYGQVWEAKASLSDEKIVAIKKVEGVFECATDAKRIFREVYYLWKLLDHPNIINLLGLCKVGQEPDSLGLVMEMTDTDLMTEIKQGNLDQENKRYITYQLFRAANYLHAANIVHRDFKPENVLLTSEHVVKVCDFGAARSLSMVGMEDVTEEPPLTDMVGTLWYLAPEVLMGSVSYTKAADVWSLGCVVVEMMTGIPMATGCGRYDHLAKILSYLPKPTQEDIESLRSPYAATIERIASDVSSRIKRMGLAKLMAQYPGELVDLVARMLRFNPTRRCKMVSALGHPYLARYHDPTLEPSPDRDIVPPLSEWHTLGIEEYRVKIYEIMTELNEAERWRDKETMETGPSDSAPSTSNQDTPPTAHHAIIHPTVSIVLKDTPPDHQA